MTTSAQIRTETTTAILQFPSDATCTEHLAMLLRLLTTVGFQQDMVRRSVNEIAEYGGWDDIWPEGEA